MAGENGNHMVRGFETLLHGAGLLQGIFLLAFPHDEGGDVCLRPVSALIGIGRDGTTDDIPDEVHEVPQGDVHGLLPAEDAGPVTDPEPVGDRAVDDDDRDSGARRTPPEIFS